MGKGVAVLNDLYFNMMMYLGCHVVDVFCCCLVWLSLQHGCVVFRLLSWSDWVLLRWCAVLLQWSLWSLCEASSCGLYPLASKWNLYSFWSILVGFLMLSLEKVCHIKTVAVSGITPGQWQPIHVWDHSRMCLLMSGISGDLIWIVHAGQTYYNHVVYCRHLYFWLWMML